jgi:NAD(P)H-dependent FMN reductase
MSMPASDPVKMRAARDWVVAVIVTSAGADGGLAVTDHWAPLLSASRRPAHFRRHAGLIRPA